MYRRLRAIHCGCCEVNGEGGLVHVDGYLYALLDPSDELDPARALARMRAGEAIEFKGSRLDRVTQEHADWLILRIRNTASSQQNFVIGVGTPTFDSLTVHWTRGATFSLTLPLKPPSESPSL